MNHMHKTALRTTQEEKLWLQRFLQRAIWLCGRLTKMFGYGISAVNESDLKGFNSSFYLLSWLTPYVFALILPAFSS